jgi:glucose-1-phosphate cytidylyltransferase
MVTYGDGVSDIPLDKVFEFHTKHNKIGTTCGVHPRSKYGLAKLDEAGLVKRFVEKPVLSDWVNGGFMFFKREFLNYLKVGELEHDGLKRLIAKKQLTMYRHDGFWYAVDTYKELEDLNSIWNSGKAPWKVWK